MKKTFWIEIVMSKQEKKNILEFNCDIKTKKQPLGIGL
jgi:hypothetical protein